MINTHLRQVADDSASIVCGVEEKRDIFSLYMSSSEAAVPSICTSVHQILSLHFQGGSVVANKAALLTWHSSFLHLMGLFHVLK